MSRLFSLVCLSCLLLGCASNGAHVADGKPLLDIQPEQVADATPRADPILAAGNTSPYRVNGKEYTVLPTSIGYRERGIASWYGRKFHGRLTANGEVFDAYAATAAHRSLPLPAYVRVTNLENYRSIVVRVNDRGPFHADRIIDLSYGAAVKLGFAEAGTARVELASISVEGVEDLRQDPALSDWKQDYRFLQVGSFAEKRSAHVLQQRLSGELALAEPVRVTEFRRGRSIWYRVRVGPYESRQALLDAMERLAQAGYPDSRPIAE